METLRNLDERIKNTALITKPRQFLDELFSFMKQYAVIGAAIGLIIAQVTKDLVDALVKGIILPFLSLLTPDSDFGTLVFVVKGARFEVGLLMKAMLTFIIVLSIVYIAVNKLLKLDDLLKKKEE